MGCGSIIKKNNMKDDEIINYNPINEIKNGKIITLYPNHNL